MAEELIKLGGYVVQGQGTDEIVSWVNEQGFLTEQDISNKQDKLTAIVDVKIASSESEAQSHTSDNILYLVKET